MTPDITIYDKTWIISRKSIASFFGVTTAHLAKYESDARYGEPLERVDSKEFGLNPKSVFYDFKYAIDWHRRNVKTGNSPTDTKNSNEGVYDGEEINENNAIVAKNVEDAKVKKLERKKREIELKVLEGEYINIDEVDAREAATGAILASGLQNMKEVFPSVAHDKSKQEIAEIFDDEAEDTMRSIMQSIRKRGGDPLYKLVSAVVKDTTLIAKAKKCLKL